MVYVTFKSSVSAAWIQNTGYVSFPLPFWNSFILQVIIYTHSHSLYVLKHSKLDDFISVMA